MRPDDPKLAGDVKEEHYYALPPATKLFEYEIESVLGHGGFGITYLAKDTLLQEAVAIKEFLPTDVAVRASNATVRPKSNGDTEMFRDGLSSFLDEARLIARFRHPNIMQVRRFFEHNGTGYIVMTYERGLSLDGVLRKRSLPEAELRPMLIGIIDGLKVVHDRAILHRDLKPSNIIIREDNTPVLIDFGAAREFKGRLSRAITAIATPGYAPPEQYGAGGQQGPWTDFYALGAIAYRCVTGRSPPDSLRRLRSDPLEPAEKVASGKYTPALLRAIDWMLRIDEAERPLNAEDLKAALSATGASAVPSRGRKGLSMALLGGVAAALLVAAGAGYWFLGRGESGLVVDASGRGTTRSIQDAIARAPEGATIRIRPGLYRESVQLGGSVALVGDGDNVVIESGSEPCVRISGTASLQKLTLRGNSDCVLVTGGAPVLEDLKVEAGGKALLASGTAQPQIRQFRVATGRYGLSFEGDAKGNVDGAELVGIEEAAVQVRGGAAPVLRAVSVIDPLGAGFLIAENSRPTISGARVRGARLSGLEVRDRAVPSVADSEFRDGQQSGIYVHSGGGGTFSKLTLERNGLPQIALEGESPAVFTGNTVKDGRDHGIYVTNQGTGRFEQNTIEGNARNGIAVDRGARPVLAANKVGANQEPQIRVAEPARPVISQ